MHVMIMDVGDDRISSLLAILESQGNTFGPNDLVVISDKPGKVVGSDDHQIYVIDDQKHLKDMVEALTQSMCPSAWVPPPKQKPKKTWKPDLWRK